jgi:hypothetical protein
MGTTPSQVTELLRRWSGGDDEALNALVPLVYEDLRRLAQDLARSAPKSNYIAYNFGNVYAEIAVSHVALASDPHLRAAEQIEHWREARSWYLKSLEIWLELRRQGKLAGDEVARPEGVPMEIARCDKH